MNKKKALIVVTVICLSIFLLWFSLLRNTRDDQLMREGDKIVKRIEKYKEENNKLPNTLEDVGIKIIDEANPPIYYENKDKLNYIIWFGTTLGESKIYYSDSKHWENHYREMK